MNTPTLEVDRLSLDDYPDANWLEDGRCDECGEPISRYWIHGEESAWFDDDGVEHDDSVCPTLDDENENEDDEEE